MLIPEPRNECRSRKFVRDSHICYRLVLKCIFVNFCHLQSHEFFFFAASIIAVGILFAVMSYFYKYIDPVKLIAHQSGEGHDPPNYTDENGNSSYPENKSLLSDSSPEENALSEIDTEEQGFVERKVKPSDESEL